MKIFNLDSHKFQTTPFPHFCTERVLDKPTEANLFHWLKDNLHWEKVKTDFYQQYEFSLLDVSPPDHLSCLTDRIIVNRELLEVFQDSFGIKNIELVGITAHKHVGGQSIGIHNDFIGKEETHRLVIQLNESWNPENGGFLMLFNSMNAQDVAKVIQPLSSSGICFEISPKSFHAVSKVYDFERYSLVYTFREK